MSDWIVTGWHGQPIECVTENVRPIIPRTRMSTKIDRKFLIDLHNEIVQGVSPVTALTMMGIPTSTARAWLKSDRPECAKVRAVIEHGQAHAAASAEKRVHTAKPLEWLKASPGRHVFDWVSEEEKSNQTQVNNQTNHVTNYNLRVLSDSELNSLESILASAIVQNPPTKTLTDGGAGR